MHSLVYTNIFLNYCFLAWTQACREKPGNEMIGEKIKWASVNMKLVCVTSEQILIELTRDGSVKNADKQNHNYHTSLCYLVTTSHKQTGIQPKPPNDMSRNFNDENQLKPLLEAALEPNVTVRFETK